jgi:hypothetical protein
VGTVLVIDITKFINEKASDHIESLTIHFLFQRLQISHKQVNIKSAGNFRIEVLF